MSKKINRQLIQNILSSDERTTSVSAEAVDWIIELALAAARQLAETGRRSESGRLMAPSSPPASALASRKPREITICGDGVLGHESIRSDDVWSPYHDWQQLRRENKTTLPYSKWKEQQEKNNG